jgi:hypothetical protein
MTTQITKTVIKKAALALALSSAALVAVPAQAAVISYDFSVTVDTVTSPLFNQSFAGSFSYDDAVVPTTGFDGEDLFPLVAFSFDFAGNLYGLSDLFYGDAAVSMSAELLGLDAGALDFSFLPANTLFPAAFAYDFGAGDAGNGSLVFTPAADAPEPALLWLLSGGVALLGLSRRRFSI